MKGPFHVHEFCRSDLPVPVAAVASASGFVDRRGGHHCCAYETYATLKKIHKAFWADVRKQAAMHRWLAKKLPENRKGACPTHIPEFAVETSTGTRAFCKRDDKGRVIRTPVQVGEKTIQMPTLVTRAVTARFYESHEIVELFRRARTPHANPVAEFTGPEYARIAFYRKVLQDQPAK